MTGHDRNVTEDSVNNVTVPPAGDGGADPLPFLQHLWEWVGSVETLLLIRLLTTALALVAAFMFARIMRRQLRLSAERRANRSKLDPWQTRALVSRTRPLSMVVALALYIAAVLVVLAVWQIQTAFISLLTAAGFAGIVIGLAAQSSLSNLVAGFMIFYNNPFDIGDWVEIDGIQGIVLDVKPGATIIESWDGEKITLPNRMVDASRIHNKSHHRKLRWRFTVGVDYATDIEKARHLLLRIIKGHPEVLTDPEPQIVALSFGDSSINLEVRFWLAPLRASGPAIQTWLMQEIQRGFAKEGIVIPFPQRTVVWRYESGNPPPGDTVSRLAYDPAADPRPVPHAPELRPVGVVPQEERQSISPRLVFERFLRREGRRISALDTEPESQGGEGTRPAAPPPDSRKDAAKDAGKREPRT